MKYKVTLEFEVEYPNCSTGKEVEEDYKLELEQYKNIDMPENTSIKVEPISPKEKEG